MSGATGRETREARESAIPAIFLSRGGPAVDAAIVGAGAAKSSRAA
jgi:hypothetical protein